MDNKQTDTTQKRREYGQSIIIRTLTNRLGSLNTRARYNMRKREGKKSSKTRQSNPDK